MKKLLINSPKRLQCTILKFHIYEMSVKNCVQKFCACNRNIKQNIIFCTRTVEQTVEIINTKQEFSFLKNGFKATTKLRTGWCASGSYKNHPTGLAIG